MRTEKAGVRWAALALMEQRPLIQQPPAPEFITYIQHLVSVREGELAANIQEEEAVVDASWTLCQYSHMDHRNAL